ncbi:MAG TPA: hypothetical protein VG944_07290 [Fimbriimonas sp.]|nr:hypothetical protein [Fimbriimonas sp.]
MMRLLVEFSADPRIARVQVLSLEKNSPLEAVLRVVSVNEAPVKIPGVKPRKAIIRGSSQPIRNLEKVFSAVSQPKTPKSFDPNTWLSLGDFAKQLKNDVAHITTSKAEMVIDSRIADEINKKLGPVHRSRGSITGILEGINVHSKPWNFTVYPKIGPVKVRCLFDESVFPSVQKGIRHVVTVTGLKEFVGDAPWPIRMNAESVEIREAAPEGAWLKLVDNLSQLWDSSEEDERLLISEAVG